MNEPAWRQEGGVRLTSRWLLLGLLAVACGGASAPAPEATPSPATVHVGIVGSVSDSALFIADSRGYFKEQGITVDFQRFQSAAVMTPALGRGQLDVGAGAPSAGLFNAMAREIPLKIVADKGNVKPGHGYEAYVVRKQLWDSGQLKSPGDLKGRTVAIAALDIAPEVELDNFLRSGGLTVKDVKLTPLAFPDMVTALATGSVDMANIIEPYATQAVSKGVGAVWHRSDELNPGHQLGVVLYSPDFAKKQDLARRFMLAYLKGARDYNDAFDKKDSAKRAAVVKILTEQTSVKDASLYDRMVMPGIDPNGKVNKDSLVSDQDWFLKYGSQKQKADLNQGIDTSFAAWAVQKLGQYK